MSIRKAIEALIIAVAVDNKLEITQADLMRTANEVEAGVYDSVDSALSNVLSNELFEEKF